MKTPAPHKLALAVALILIPSISSAAEPRHPPENAAIVYNQAFKIYQKPRDKHIKRMLADLVAGKTKPDQRITQYIQKNQPAIKLAETAADIKNCDWKLDYSTGSSIRLTHLGPMNNLAKIVIADARILAAKHNFNTALQRCLTAHKMARHVGNQFLIGYLVATSITESANKPIPDIISQMPLDKENLKNLNKQLEQIDRNYFSFKAAVKSDAEPAAVEITERMAEQILEINLHSPRNEMEKIARRRIGNADRQFFENNRKYWLKHTNAVIAAADLPYPQAYEELKRLEQKPKNDAIENPDATITAIIVPASSRVYAQNAIARNFSNAIRAAVNIYIVKAQTGQLPQTMPPALAKDLFSQQDFQYIKTQHGFVLRSPQKDLLKQKIHEYEFKISP